MADAHGIGLAGAEYQRAFIENRLWRIRRPIASVGKTPIQVPEVAHSGAKGARSGVRDTHSGTRGP